MAKEKTQGILQKYVLPIGGVSVMLVVLYALISHFQGFTSIGAFAYIEGERDMVLFYGFHSAEDSDDDYQEALLRDAASGEPIAESYWPDGGRILERNSDYLWIKSDDGLALYSATTLEELLDRDMILERNPFLDRQLGRAKTIDKTGKFPTAFDEATGRLLVGSGKSLYVLGPDGKALASSDAEPFTSKPRARPPKGPCRDFKVKRICGAAQRCIAASEPGKYGKVALALHGGSSARAEKPASFYEPKVLHSGRSDRCVDTFDDSGAVLVIHKASPQDREYSTLSMVRGDGSEAWSVPLASFGKDAEIDLAVPAKGAARLYGSIAGDAAPLGGDYGYMTTIDLASGAPRASVVIRK